MNSYCNLWILERTPQSIQSLYFKFEKTLEKYREHDYITVQAFSTACIEQHFFFWQYWSGGTAKLFSDSGFTAHSPPYSIYNVTQYPRVLDINQACHLFSQFLFSSSTFLLLFNHRCSGKNCFGTFYLYKKPSLKARLSFTNGKTTNLLNIVIAWILDLAGFISNGRFLDLLVSLSPLC